MYRIDLGCLRFQLNRWFNYQSNTALPRFEYGSQVNKTTWETENKTVPYKCSKFYIKYNSKPLEIHVNEHNVNKKKK